jgi:hypothetical protein
MREKCLRSPCTAAVGDGQGNPIVTNLEENVVTNYVQTTYQFAVSDVINDTTAKDLGSVSEQVTMSAIQWQHILASVKYNSCNSC